MQESRNSWRTAFMAWFAFILSFVGFGFGSLSLTTGCDIVISTSESASQGNGDSSGDQPEPMTTNPMVPTTGDTNPDPTAEPPPTTSGTDDPTEATGPMPETSGVTDGDDEPVCGNNGIPFEDALVWPICYQDSPSIEEGWIYSDEEQGIHGTVCHKALDIKAEYGTKVRAMASGWCLATFETAPGLNERGQKMGFGGGLLVVCWADELQLFIQYLHLSALGLNIPYYTPSNYVSEEGFPSLSPSLIIHPSYEFVEYAVYIEEGEDIGEVGVSGLSIDGEEEESKNPPKVISWDGPHVHVAFHGDRDRNGKKDPKTVYDPINLYTGFEDYENVFEICEGMIACDPQNVPAPLFPWQCDGIPLKAHNGPPSEVAAKDAA